MNRNPDAFKPGAQEDTVAALPLAAQGGAAAAFLAAFDRKQAATVGYRAVVAAADASLSLVQQGEVVWAREEALGHVRQAHFAELPPAPLQGLQGDADLEDDVWARVQRQLRFQVCAVIRSGRVGFGTGRDRQMALERRPHVRQGSHRKG